MEKVLGGLKVGAVEAIQALRELVNHQDGRVRLLASSKLIDAYTKLAVLAPLNGEHLSSESRIQVHFENQAAYDATVKELQRQHNRRLGGGEES